MGEGEGVGLGLGVGVGLGLGSLTLTLTLTKYLLGRAVARREAEQAREKSLNDLDVTLRPEGLFVPVDAERLWRRMRRAPSWCRHSPGSRALLGRILPWVPAGLLCAPPRAVTKPLRSSGAMAPPPSLAQSLTCMRVETQVERAQRGAAGGRGPRGAAGGAGEA